MSHSFVCQFHSTSVINFDQYVCPVPLLNCTTNSRYASSPVLPIHLCQVRREFTTVRLAVGRCYGVYLHGCSYALWCLSAIRGICKLQATLQLGLLIFWWALMSDRPNRPQYAIYFTSWTYFYLFEIVQKTTNALAQAIACYNFSTALYSWYSTNAVHVASVVILHFLLYRVFSSKSNRRRRCKATDVRTVCQCNFQVRICDVEEFHNDLRNATTWF